MDDLATQVLDKKETSSGSIKYLILRHNNRAGWIRFTNLKPEDIPAVEAYEQKLHSRDERKKQQRKLVKIEEGNATNYQKLENQQPCSSDEEEEKQFERKRRAIRAYNNKILNDNAKNIRDDPIFSQMKKNLELQTKKKKELELQQQEAEFKQQQSLSFKDIKVIDKIKSVTYFKESDEWRVLIAYLGKDGKTIQSKWICAEFVQQPSIQHYQFISQKAKSQLFQYLQKSNQMGIIEDIQESIEKRQNMDCQINEDE